MKGILLAAGKGTRLYPMTLPVCKPLLPVYDKPLIYYPLAALLQAGIDDILVIIPPDEGELFERLLGDGSRLGVRISYAVQPVPRGIADAFLVGEAFIGDDPVCLVLGDNIFHEKNLPDKLARARANTKGATIFGYYVEDPRAFGVVEFDESGRAISIEEKPRYPKSNYIVPGLYFYDNRVVEIAKSLKPSARGELEITDINNRYLQMGELSVITLDRDFVWLDAGTADNLLAASQEVRRVQEETGRYIACIEEIACSRGFINEEQVHEQGLAQSKTLYGQYLMCL